ncbi:MAG: glycoside hydrolase family 1 protein [Polyangiaceae bacterium]
MVAWRSAGGPIAVAGLAVALAVGCHGSASSSSSAPPARVEFPAGFMWGSSTAGFQVEAGDAHTDWSHWVAAGKISSGDSPDVGGPDALAHIDDDVAALVSSGQNTYRFSVEWGRVFPTEAALLAGTPDAAGVAPYDTLIQKLAAAHVTPLVTLAHFSMPDWLSDGTPATTGSPQGWERPQALDDFAAWCTFAAARWGSSVDWWVTINEPLPYVLGGFVQGSFPPGDVLNIDRALSVARIEAYAHARCYDAIHAADTVDADGDGKAAQVSVAKHQRTFHPLDATDPDDAAAAEHVRYLWNEAFLNAIVHGDWDADFDGAYTSPGDVQGDPALVGRADYIGVNYYSDTLISASHGGVKIPAPVNAVVLQRDMGDGRPISDFGWDIYPEGMGTVLDETAAYGLPMIVTENGLADAADVNRARFLLEHLYQVGWAIQRGDPVIGYTHWALVDNFEWANGYCPHFGLFRYDRSTGVRTPKGSVATYTSIIASGTITTDDVSAAPAYTAPAAECFP